MAVEIPLSATLLMLGGSSGIFLRRENFFSEFFSVNNIFPLSNSSKKRLSCKEPEKCLNLRDSIVETHDNNNNNTRILNEFQKELQLW